MTITAYNPTAERVLDITFHAADFVKAAIYSPFYCLRRVITAAIVSPLLLYPQAKPDLFVGKGIKSPEIAPRELTPASIKGGFYNLSQCATSEKISEEKLQKTLESAQSIAAALGISQGIKLYSSEATQASTVFGCPKTARTRIPVFIDRHTLLQSEDSINLVLAHEISHAAHNDFLRVWTVDLAVITIEVLAVYFIGVLTIPLIEAIASSCQNFLERRQEFAADCKAMTILNSNAGCVEFLENSISGNQKTREEFELVFKFDRSRYLNISEPFLLKCLIKGVSLISKDFMVCHISPEGKYRPDLTHPPLRDRLKVARNFKAKQS